MKYPCYIVFWLENNAKQILEYENYENGVKDPSLPGKSMARWIAPLASPRAIQEQIIAD
jgi:hypothetical protein